MKSGKKLGRVLRIVGLLVIAFMNTVLIRPEEAGSFRNYIGYLLLVFAIVDCLLFIRSIKRERYDETSN